MKSIRLVFATLTLLLPLFLSAQVTFADALPGCLNIDNFQGTNCQNPANGFIGVNALGEFEFTGIHGVMCCGGMNGSNDAYVEFETIDISSFMNISISMNYRGENGSNGNAYENASPAAPLVGCNAGSNTNACSGASVSYFSHDQLVFYYSLNGGPYILGEYIVGCDVTDFTGIWMESGLNGNTLKIKVVGKVTGQDESIFLKNLVISGTPKPFNAGPDQTTCNLNAVTLSGTGVGTWSGGAGTFGNVNNPVTTYTPAASELGTTVTLTFSGKPGTPGCAGPYPAPSDDVDVIVAPGPEAVFTGGEALCQGECSDVTVTISGGTPPFTISFSATFGSLPAFPISNVVIPSFDEVFTICYTTSTFPLPQWNAGTNTISIPANAAGTSGNFTLLTITDANNCPGTVSGSVDYDFLLQPQANPYLLSQCGNASGQAEFNFNEAEPFILGSEVGFVHYYTDIALTNEIFSPYISSGEIVYAVIENTDGCISIPVELTLQVKPPGDVGPVSLACNPCNICDGDGVLGEDITVNIILPTNGSYNVDYAYNIGGNITNVTESVLGPLGSIDVNINGDASFVLLSVTEGLECPDNTGLGNAIVVTYSLKPDVTSVGILNSCAPITLPIIAVTNPISGGTTGYFTGPNGTGTKYNPGDVIIASTVLYIYSGNPDCFDQEQVTINIGGLTTYAEPKDTAVCGQLILPAIGGTGVSGQAAYFTAPAGGGTKYKVGDTIKNSITLFIFEPSNPACQTNNPDIAVTITAPPQIKLDSTVIACEQYKLPKITGTNLPGNQAYYSNPGFTGIPDSVGTLVIKTDTFYLYTGTATCFDKDTLYVKIKKNTSYDPIADINACNSYQLPPIQGINVDTSAYYYTQPNGQGTIYKVGDILTSPITLYVFDTLNKCQVNTAQFNVTVAPGPEIFAIKDTTVCETFTLQNITGTNITTAAYFTGPNGSGQKLLAGESVTNTGVIYAYEANVACATEKSFLVTVEKKPKSGLGKVIGQCQDKNATIINLFDLLTGPFDNNGVWTSTNGTFNLSDPTKVQIPANTPAGTYKFSYAITPAVCAPALTFSDFILVAEPNAGIDSTLTLCQGSPTLIDLFKVLKNTSATTGKFASTFAIADPTKLSVAALNVGKYEIQYSLQNSNTPSNTFCNDTAKITINIVAGQNAGLNANETVCKGAVVELKDLVSGQTSIGTFKEKTNTGKLVGSQFNTTGLNPGIFTIYHIIPANGSCKADTSELLIEVKNLISAGNDIAKTYCELQAIDLDSLIAAQNIGGTFVFSGFGGSLDNNGLFTPNIPATFEIKYKVGDGVICPTDEASVTLTFIESPDISLTVIPSICFGEDLKLNVDGEGGFGMDVIVQTEAQYNSGNINAFISKTPVSNLNANLELSFNASLFKPDTKYFISIKKATLGLCTYDVNEVQPLTVKSSPTKQVKGNYCEGDEVTIGGVKFSISNTKDTLLVNNPLGCDSVLFVNLAFAKATKSDYNFTTCNSEFKYTINGQTFDINKPTGSVLLNVKNYLGCDSTVNVSLAFEKPALTTKIEDAPCEDGTGVLSLEKASLLKGSPVLYINGTKTDSIISFPKDIFLSPGDYNIQLIDRDDCKTTTDVTIDVGDEPTVSIKETILPDGSKQLSVVSSAPLASFKWSPIGLVNCAECPVTNVIDFGTVTLDYTYGDNCEGQLSYKVVKEVVKNIFFPSIINTSSSSGNNIFYPKKPEDYNVQAIAMTIYDRWGNLVWQRKNFEIGLPENGWDGSFNGKDLQPGVYVYTLETLDSDNIAKTFVGDVTLIK